MANAISLLLISTVISVLVGAIIVSAGFPVPPLANCGKFEKWRFPDDVVINTGGGDGVGDGDGEEEGEGEGTESNSTTDFEDTDTDFEDTDTDCSLESGGGFGQNIALLLHSQSDDESKCIFEKYESCEVFFNIVLERYEGELSENQQCTLLQKCK
tara:strand:+ start:168 stop:635 length:468 start_codon:yes stop_codon:yes gene_type:complete